MFIVGYDFYYMWSAAHVALHGGNPYDLHTYSRELSSIGWPSDEAIPPFPHPPWALSLYLMVGFLPFKIALTLWLALAATTLFFCFRWIYRNLTFLRMADRPPKMLLYSFLLLCFPPTIKILLWGQLSFLLLVGLLLFLVLYSRQRHFLAGLSLSLTLIKPDLLVLYSALLACSYKQRNFSVLTGLAFGLLLQVLVVLVLCGGSAEFLAGWLTNVQATSVTVVGPTISQILANLLDAQWVALLTVALGGLIGLFYGTVRKLDISDLSSRLPVLSLLFAPYAWTHDFVLLIIPYLATMMSFERRFGELAALFVATSLCLVSFLLSNVFVKEQIMVVFPILLFIGIFHSHFRIRR